MDVHLEMTNALNDFDVFIKLLNEKENSAAFGLLKRINLPLVGKYYKEKYATDSKEMAIYNCANAMLDLLKLQDEYDKSKLH